MAKTKEQKKEILREIKDYLKEKKSMVFFSFSGLKVEDFAKLRKDVKKEEVLIKVVKKTLFELAISKDYPEVKEKIEYMKEQFAVMFIFSEDFSSLKSLYRFSKKNENLKILGGYFENKFLDSESVNSLAEIPSRKEILEKLVYIISSPQRKFINILEGNIYKLLITISLIEKRSMDNR